MEIEFYGKKFDKYERLNTKAYIGYFSNEGKLIDYNTSLGGSHSTLGNIVPWTFLLWIKESNQFKNFGLQDIKMSASINMDTGVIKNASMPTRSYLEKTNILLLQRDLIEFLKRIESNPELIKLIKDKIEYSKIPEYIRKDKKLPISVEESSFEIESVLGCYNTHNLLLLLKDFCVQYLGYDSIEQIMPNGQFITIPKYYLLYPDDYYTYFDKPRIITTSNRNIYERFYNYLLMDYVVCQIPRYVYNEKNKLYELDNMQDYNTHMDDICKKEIESIKRLVPLRQREKYFR